MVAPSVHRVFYILGLALSLCSLPFSPFAVSVGLFVASISWLLEAKWHEKGKRFAREKSLHIFLLIYTPSILGLLASENLTGALIELRLWLPLLIMPIVVATSDPFSRKEMKLLLSLFSASVLAATFIGTFLISRHVGAELNVSQAVSPFISHIRLSLMVVFAVFIHGYYALKPDPVRSLLERLGYLISGIWLFLFLIAMQVLTGIVVSAILLFVLVTVYSLKVKDQVYRFSLIVFITFIVLFIFTFLAHHVDKFYTRNYINLAALPAKTANGNSYSHDTLKRQYENGNLVWVNVCEQELAEQWTLRSSLSFDKEDHRGQSLKQTLIRYLTSKGLRKDSSGIAQLEPDEIRLIEHGCSSVLSKDDRIGIRSRFYRILWEIDAYNTSSTIAGGSIIQRYIYLKASWFVIANHPFLGVGTGDIQESLNDYYGKNSVNLDDAYWHFPHNQYATVWVATGLVGLLLFLCGLTIPFFLKGLHKQFLPLVFHLIILLSMINEDTLETHIGVSFAALFWSIFLFGYDYKSE